MRSIRIQGSGVSGGINNAIRGLAAIVKRAVGSQGSAIASAATTAIGTAGTALYTTITGATSITSFGSVGAGTFRIVEFTGVLTLTHNATSLKLPGSANIVTAAGDVGFLLSLGSGNWKCLHYSKADGSAVAGFNGTLISTDPGAGDGPNFEAFRDSASPAANDEIGQLIFTGRSSTGVKRTYGFVDCIILDPTNASEDSSVRLVAAIAGAPQAVLQAADGVVLGAATFKGLGTLNAAAGVYVAGHGTVAQAVRDTEAAYTTLGTILPADNSIPQNTEGSEILSVAITPTNASSILRIRVNLMVGHASAGGQVCAALFVDSSVGALAAAGQSVGNSTTVESLSFEYTTSAGSTSARTYKVRAGSDAASDAFLNGNASSRIFGGVAVSSLEVEEVLPQ